MASRQMKDLDKAMVANLRTNTGKTLTQWLAVIKKSKLSKHGEIVAYLKDTCGIGHGYADLLARRARAGANPVSTDLVAAQYTGAKQHLRRIYDKVVKAVGKFGADVEVAPKKSYVSLRRNKQFAIVQASTKDRVDIGLVLKGESATRRLQKAGSFNAMMTHRVSLSDAKDIDRQLIGWLRAAYDKS